MSLSVDLQWELVRNNNSFLVKRNGVAFSTERGNLAGKHCYKYSGLAQRKIVDVQLAKDGAIAVSHRRSKAAPSLVAKGMSKPTIFKRPNTRRIGSALETSLKASFYRNDLIHAAKARASVLITAARSKKNIVKKLRANKLAKLSAKRN